MEKIKVLLADDSHLMRILFSMILSEQEDIEVLDSVENGKEAFEKTQELKPNVVLLDMIMNDYDGLYAVDNIMKHCPTPIILLSGLEKENEMVFEALNRGAYDFLAKPRGKFNSKVRSIQDELLQKIRQVHNIDISTLGEKKKSINQHMHTFEKTNVYQILVIGASTGGTSAIEAILQNLPTNFPIPVIIAQHISQNFVNSFTERLNNLSPIRVSVAKENTIIRPNQIYVLSVNKNMIIKKTFDSSQSYFQFTNKKYKAYNLPSVDSIMESVAQVYQQKSIGVILTGMGTDGTLGLGKIYKNGGFTIAQNRESSVVFGMPKSAIEEGVIKEVLDIKEIANFVVGLLD